MVYSPKRKQTGFAIWKDNKWSIEGGINPTSNQRLVPYSAENNLIKNEVVLFPSEPQEYGSEEQLLSRQRFSRQYSAEFEVNRNYRTASIEIARHALRSKLK